MPSVMWLIQKNANSNPYFLFNNGGVVIVNVFLFVYYIPIHYKPSRDMRHKM